LKREFIGSAKGKRLGIGARFGQEIWLKLAAMCD
jgi:hypothetical protein